MFSNLPVATNEVTLPVFKEKQDILKMSEQIVELSNG